MLFVGGLFGIGSIAGFAEVGKILGQVTDADLDLGDDVILGQRLHAVHLVAGIGEDVPLPQMVNTVAIFQLNLALEYIDELNVQMIVQRILHDVAHGYIDGEIIREGQFFQKHSVPPACIGP